MSKKHHQSSGRTGFAAVVIASGCCSLAMAACAARVAQSSTVAAAPAEHRTTASTGKTDLPSRENEGADIEPAAGHVASTDSRRSATPATSIPNPMLARGDELFAKHCTICHGENGDGAGKFAYLMNPRPRDFRQGDFKLATTQNQIPTLDDLVRTISRGMPGSAIPPWDHLPLADLRSLAAYVRQFHEEGTRAKLQAWVSEGSFKEAEGV